LVPALVAQHARSQAPDSTAAARVALVTTLREPVGRLLSAYEFVVEVAIRSLGGSEANRTAAYAKKKAEDKMITSNIWPWSHLLPWFREDLQARRDKRLAAHAKLPVPADPYNAPELVMPLTEFISHPLVQATLHNGATLQVTRAGPFHSTRYHSSISFIDSRGGVR
jgi:hypothetical protein